MSLVVQKDRCLIEKDGKLVAPYFSRDKQNSILLDKIVKSDSDTLVIFGSGCCDLILNETLKNISKNVVFYEPIEEVYRENLVIVQNKLTKNLFYTNESPDKFGEYLERNQLSSIFLDVISYGDYANSLIETYHTILQSIRDVMKRLFTNDMTNIRHSKKFTRNLLTNLFTLRCNGTIHQLKNRFKDIPALIVSAGPSLEKNYDLIKNFKGIIFSGGRTYIKLLEEDISNIFFVSIDPHINVYKLVENGMDKTKNKVLFMPFEGSCEVANSFLGKKVFMESTNIDFSQILKESYDDLIDLGGSVANASVSIAEYIGCNPIVFIGQDLSISDGKHHADFTVKDFDQSYTYEAEYEVDGYYENKVKTTSALKIFLWWFEKTITNSDKTYFNCTEGGAYIKGCNHIAFNEYLKMQSNIVYEVEHILETTLTENPESLITVDIHDFRDELIAMINEVTYSVKLSDKIRSRFKERKDTDYIVEELNNHDKKLNSHEIINPFIEFMKLFMNTMHAYTTKNKNVGPEEYGYYYYSLLKNELETILEVVDELRNEEICRNDGELC